MNNLIVFFWVFVLQRKDVRTQLSTKLWDQNTKQSNTTLNLAFLWWMQKTNTIFLQGFNDIFTSLRKTLIILSHHLTETSCNWQTSFMAITWISKNIRWVHRGEKNLYTFLEEHIFIYLPCSDIWWWPVSGAPRPDHAAHSLHAGTQQVSWELNLVSSRFNVEIQFSELQEAWWKWRLCRII